MIPLPGRLRRPHLFRLAGKDGGEKGRWVPFVAGFRALKNLPRSNPFRPSCSREGRSRASASQKKAGAGRVAGPYRTPANPYFLASFERKAFLQQILNRCYSQIWCTITGGAYQIARRVTTCVRNICKSDSCLNRTAGRTPRPQAPLFFPIFSGKTEKIGPPGARQKRPRRNESPRHVRSLLSSEPVSSSFPPNRFAGFAGKHQT